MRSRTRRTGSIGGGTPVGSTPSRSATRSSPRRASSTRRPAAPGSVGSEPRLTIYTRRMRNAPDPLLDVFDLPLFFNSSPSRDTTTTPLQSLLLINGQGMILHARALARRAGREASGGPGPGPKVEAAYRLAFGRRPSPEEAGAALEFLREQALRVDPGAAGSADAAFLHDKIPYRDGQAAILSPDGEQQRLEASPRGPMTEGPFTLEGFFLLRSVHKTGAVRTVAAKWDGDPKRPGWAFGVTGEGSRRKPQTLVLQLIGDRREGGPGEQAIFSDQHVQIDRPYYFGVAFTNADDKGPGTASFYLKDLSNDDEPLQVARVPHDVTGGIGNALPLTFGGRSGKPGGSFDGLIDDVRLTDGALDVGQLLYTSEGDGRRALGHWRFEPEPGVFRDSTGHGLDLRPAARASSRADPDATAFEDFCHVLLNSSEFLYVH